MIQRHNNLAWILNTRGAEGEKFGRYRPGTGFRGQWDLCNVEKDAELTCHASCICAAAG